MLNKFFKSILLIIVLSVIMFFLLLLQTDTLASFLFSAGFAIVMFLIVVLFFVLQPQTNSDIPGNLDKKNYESPKVIVIDDFCGECDLDFDKDGKIDQIRHGQLVRSFIKDVEVECVDPGTECAKIASLLQDIRISVGKNNNNVLAINLSLGLLKSYEEVSYALVKKITPENIENRLDELIDDIYHLINNTDADKNIKAFFKVVLDVYNEIDYLADLNVPVVIAAGNITTNNNYINLLCLNKKAIVVGGSSKFLDTKEQFYENIPLADLHARGVFENKFISDDLLLSFTSVQDYMQKHPDATMDEIRKNVNFTLAGTSYTTPYILNYVVRLKRKGLNVDQINDELNKIYQISENTDKPIEDLLDKYLENTTN